MNRYLPSLAENLADRDVSLPEFRAKVRYFSLSILVPAPLGNVSINECFGKMLRIYSTKSAVCPRRLRTSRQMIHHEDSPNTAGGRPGIRGGHEWALIAASTIRIDLSLNEGLIRFVSVALPPTAEIVPGLSFRMGIMILKTR